MAAEYLLVTLVSLVALQLKHWIVNGIMNWVSTLNGLIRFFAGMKDCTDMVLELYSIYQNKYWSQYDFKYA